MSQAQKDRIYLQTVVRQRAESEARMEAERKATMESREKVAKLMGIESLEQCWVCGEAREAEQTYLCVPCMEEKSQTARAKLAKEQEDKDEIYHAVRNMSIEEKRRIGIIL